MVNGQFTTYSGSIANRYIRLNSDGTKDVTFATGTSSVGANAFVNSIAEQSDNKLILVGGFSTIAGSTKARIARLNSNGTIDNTYNVGTGTNNNIGTVKLQLDGKALVGGSFTTYNSTAASRLVRINTDGSYDATFNTGTGFLASTASLTTVQSIYVQPDGKILIGGRFNSYNGTTVTNICRLNSDGSLDNTFNTTTNNNSVNEIRILASGKILIAGSIVTVNGVTKNRIALLNSDGSTSNTFGGTGTNNDILAVRIQLDNNILIGGNFTTYSGTSEIRIARIIGTCSTPTIAVTQTSNNCNGDATATASVSVTGGTSFTYTWLPQNTNTSSVSGLAAG